MFHHLLCIALATQAMMWLLSFQLGEDCSHRNIWQFHLDWPLSVASPAGDSNWCREFWKWTNDSRNIESKWLYDITVPNVPWCTGWDRSPCANPIFANHHHEQLLKGCQTLGWSQPVLLQLSIEICMEIFSRRRPNSFKTLTHANGAQRQNRFLRVSQIP